MMGEEKAALLLMQLGPQVMEAVLGRVAPARADRLRAHIQRFQASPPPSASVSEVFGELERSLKAKPSTPSPPPASKTPVAPKPAPPKAHRRRRRARLGNQRLPGPRNRRRKPRSILSRKRTLCAPSAGSIPSA
jgi:hypothetical protein